MVKNKKITVSIASIPSRIIPLEITINSLISQVDILNVYLNNYKNIPSFLYNKKIIVMRSQDYKDLGDIGKFYWIDKIDGYHFTCDDDIIYPNNYIQSMIKEINKYNGFISYHGVIFKQPFKSFTNSKTTYHFRRFVGNDYLVNLLGTGVMGYDADIIKIPLDIFKHKNMADIFIAIFAKNKKIPCMVIKHKKNYLKDYYKENSSFFFLFKSFISNISNKSKKNDNIQTQLIKDNAPWDID